VGALGWTGHMSIEAPIEPSSGHRTLLADGTVVLVRRLDPADREAVLRLHAELPLDDRYLRFFSAGTAGFEQLADLVVSDASVAVGAFRHDELVGVAHYRREPSGTPPEVAVVVRHDQQHRGVATLLLEYLVAVAPSTALPDVAAIRCTQWSTRFRPRPRRAARRDLLDRRRRTAIAPGVGCRGRVRVPVSFLRCTRTR
jgi:GNAT superfamily N-acetyltransferase